MIGTRSGTTCRVLSRVVLATLLIVHAVASLGQDLGRLGLPVLVSVPAPPIPVRADQRLRLVYELHLTNTSSKPVTLNRLEVWDAERLAVLEGDELSKAIKHTGNDTKEPRTIGSGAHVVVMMWLSVDTLPKIFKHRLEGSEGNDPEALAVEAPVVSPRGTPARIAPPLRGGQWLAANGPSNDTHHRRSWLAYGGRALFPERFAIDFLRLHDDGPTKGDPAENRSWHGYGAEVIAVANARVVSIKDGIPDNVPANRAPPGMTVDTMGGNMAVLDLGNALYAFYSHLQPGSFRVSPGERVRVGQVLGLLGNSGNGNAPHLHFQVSDGPSLLLSDGVPFEFDSFVHEGRTRNNEIPLQNWIVSFR